MRTLNRALCELLAWRFALVVAGLPFRAVSKAYFPQGIGGAILGAECVLLVTLEAA